MAYKIFIFVLILFMGSFEARAECTDHGASQFAATLQKIIQRRDRAALEKIPSYPTKESLKNLDSLFDSSSEKNLFSFLNKDNLKIVTFPVSVDGVCVVYASYFDPEFISQEQLYGIDGDKLDGLWLHGYAEILLINGPSGWGFYYSPFYNESHLPWGKDY